MRFLARAPGKLVLIGEYAVLDGCPAIVMAVDRQVEATLQHSTDAAGCLRIVTADTIEYPVKKAAATGAGLVDAVISAAPALDWDSWSGELNSSAFFLKSTKLGLGSSAAALTAWAGAWWSAAAPGAQLPAAEVLIAIHRAFQGGAGSGLDVAAARHGGAIRYQLGENALPQIGSVRLPNSVGFAGIFAGTSASTVNLVGRFREWQRHAPVAAAALNLEMRDVAGQGAAAIGTGDGPGFCAALAAYGVVLDRLGGAIGADLVTVEHREIGRIADRFGVAYKVSGAGGGDLGVAASVEYDRMVDFLRDVRRHGFHVVELPLSETGLVVEEQA